MKLRFAIVASLVLSSGANANAEESKAGNFRSAKASSDSCVSNCLAQNTSCKRTCPATFSTPCLSACDSQAQTCTLSCQTK
jgi:hypothetical protein